MAWNEADIVNIEITEDKWEITCNINDGVGKVLTAHKIMQVG